MAVVNSFFSPLPHVRLKLICIARFLSYLSASLFALLSCLRHPAASQTSRRSSDRRARRETSSRRSWKEPQSSSISLWLIWESSVRVLTTHTVPLLKNTPPAHLQSSRQVYRCVFLRRWSQSEVAAAGAGAELGGGAAGGGWQGGGGAEAAADPGPAGGEQEQQSRPGVGLLGAARPAGEQPAGWGSSSHLISSFNNLDLPSEGRLLLSPRDALRGKRRRFTPDHTCALGRYALKAAH